MKKYSVLLMYPDYVGDSLEIYYTHLDAETP